ncbi:MAG: dihydrofolate reductase family protein [Lachnospiraceae bacterium]|nr:dihydrofolate reductase family protein [Lachnospiraceae bacterium]
MDLMKYQIATEAIGKSARPITTLFMLMSVDGKISTGATDEFDVDKDFPKIPGIKEGLSQYYDIELMTDLWSLNSGRVQQKMGVNVKPFPNKTPVSFVIIDNNHLNAHGVEWFCAKSAQFVLVTSNKSHPAFKIHADNLSIIYQDKFNPDAMLSKLYTDYGCKQLTIQTGGTLNGLFLRNKCFDYIDIVVAPVLIGGKDTSSLIDGDSILTQADLSKLGVLKLVSVDKLQNSYIRLRYQVM